MGRKSGSLSSPPLTLIPPHDLLNHYDFHRHNPPHLPRARGEQPRTASSRHLMACTLPQLQEMILPCTLISWKGQASYTNPPSVLDVLTDVRARLPDLLLRRFE